MSFVKRLVLAVVIAAVSASVQFMVTRHLENRQWARLVAERAELYPERKQWTGDSF